MYFAELGRHLGTAGLVITIEGDAGDPRRLVQRAIQIRDEAASKARRMGDPTFAFDQAWCCFGVDDSGPLLAEARALAGRAGLNLAMSNPCFELWLYLHYREPPGAQTTAQMQRVWRSLQPGLPDKHLDFDALKGGIDDAVRRALRTMQSAMELGEPLRNPSTEVGYLVEAIDVDGRERRLQTARQRMQGNRP